MAVAQSDFQAEILRLQEKSLQDAQALARQGTPTPSESASMLVTPEQQETEAVSTAIQKGNYQDATIMVQFRETVHHIMLINDLVASVRSTNSTF